MLGMHGAAYANLAVNDSDLIIAVGMRFDDRATCRVSGFAPKARIIHIDIDPAEIGKNVRVDVPIVGDARSVLQSLNKQLSPKLHVDWLHQLEHWKELHPSTDYLNSSGLMPQFVINKLYEVTKGDAIIVTGVGQNQMWAARNYWYDKPGSFISSGGLGTMGFELPAAIGAKVGCPDETVWSICGDGGFQMTMHELATAVQDNIAIKIAVLNNGYLGMVRQWQQLLYNRRYMATPITCPDLVKIADAYNMPGIRVTQKTEVIPAINRAMEHDGPFLIDFRIEPEANIFPFVPPGASLTEFIEDPDLNKYISDKHSSLRVSNI
jgi:acetolactate synthase I/II/III large subunit